MAPKCPVAPKCAIFIQANITAGKKLRTCLEPGYFVKVFYKMTTWPRRPILNGPKSSRLLQFWLSVILIASVYRKGKNYYPQVFLEKCKYFVKEKKMSKFITDRTGVSSDDFDRENSDK